MQYSRILLGMILGAGMLIVAGNGQEPSSSSAPAHRQLGIECDHAVPPPGMHWVCNDRNNPCNCHLEGDRSGGPSLDGEGEPQSRVSTARFEQIMNALAAASKEGSSARAADWFTKDAVYSNLTTRESYKGQAAVAKLFANKKSPTQAAPLTWHHLFFNEKDQTGAGEFSREASPRYHGVVVLKLENGKISHWREYRLASSQSWERFTAENQF